MTLEDFSTYFKNTYKNRTSSFLTGTMLLIADTISLFCCIGLAFLVVNFINTSLINFRSFIFYSFYFPLIIAVYYAAGLYPGIMISPSEEIRKICICSFFCFLGICVSIIFKEDNNLIKITTKILKDSRRTGVAAAFILALPFTVIGISVVRDFARYIFGKSKWWGVPAVIYCTGNSADEVIKRLLSRPDLGYKPALIIDSKADECSMKGNIPVFPDSKNILEIIKHLKLKTALICDYEGEKRHIMTSFRYTITISKKQDMFTTTLNLKDLGGIIGFASTHNLTKKTYLIIKRLSDIGFILFISPIAIPLMLIISILVKFSSPGKIFYGHTRVGKNKKEIKCWKFRSMYENSQEMLEKILAEDENRRKEWEKERKIQNDPRITKFGKFLRKTSIDELPQLWNILIGEMSFVGPRPVTKDELSKYEENADYILSVTPGLSGMWQISGRSDTGYEERKNLDTYYIQNWSIWLDMWIVIKTFWIVFRGKGAY